MIDGILNNQKLQKVSIKERLEEKRNAMEQKDTEERAMQERQEIR